MGSDLLWVRMSVWLALMVVCAFAGIAAILFAKAYVMGALLVSAAFLMVFVLSGVMRIQQNEVARFVDAVRFADLAQSFSGRWLSRRLAQSLNAALARLRETTVARDADAVLLRALYEHAPVPVVAIGSRGEMKMANLAALRLFGSAGAGHPPSAVRLPKEVADILAPGARAGRALVRAQINGRTMRLVVSSTSLQLRGADIRVASVQNIESELGGAEFDAWRDLIRVLTHEIMNTMTPVASLSQLIRQLADDMAREIPEDAANARAAGREIGECAETLSRRAQALLRFVDAYRELTRLPPPNPAQVAVAPMLQRLKMLFEGASGPALKIDAEPQLHLHADEGQVEQALINLITNAREAELTAGATAAIEVSATDDGAGGAVISVADIGRGIPPEIAERMFTPFFSTKSSGSGVGLSLARQIALAHGGSVDYQPRPGGGSVFTLRLPAR